ncbi:MAG TPA: VapC toxin family PIN domain ribonuclease [Nitrospiraceae bacterium]|jgi:predicted nucleic acid-binding protein|nr:VapC toxin family PIN domain ribonuclease [Nitrospiraceae bacterium]
MGVIFDTSEIITFERDGGSVDEIVRGREDEPFGISVITVAELLHGVERANTQARKIRRQAFVEKVIEFFPIFSFETTIARIYARLWASLAAKGIVVGSHDLIIAATALSMDYTIITANMRDFGKIEGLRVEKL